MNIYEGEDRSGSVQKQMSIPGLSSGPWQKEKHSDMNIFSKSSEFTHFESASVNPSFLEDGSLFLASSEVSKQVKKENKRSVI